LVQDESASRPMKPDELKILAERIFGTRWKSALGKAVGRDRVTIGRYMKLGYRIPPEVADKVREMSRLGAAGKVVFDAIHRHCWRSKPPEMHQAAKSAEAGLYATGLIEKARRTRT
jgi:hypothetical protein